MCVVLLSASLHAQAQNKETRINLNIRNATLESFVKQLENATGFSFIYGEEVKLTHRITLEMKQKNISEILQRAFENEPITFEISGKHILLHKRPVPQKPVSRKFTISGYVTDGASSETLIGANILESRRSTGTATNPFGFYSLTLPEGETELVFSYLGYESRHSRFELTKDTLLNVRLDSNNQLAEVVVLSDKREAGIESTAMGAHEIPMTQIRHTPSILGEADLLKTIQLMPGVQAGMEGFAGMYVRGGGPDQNLVMLDGIPVYNADHLLGVFSIFTPEAVKNTTLFKSSFPTRYGGRLSSIVNEIINREDVILTDGHPGNYDDEENELFPTINNKYNIFNDNTFRDSYATLKVYTPLYQEYYPVEGHYYDHISRKQTITVRLLSITEAEYRYLKALNCLDDGDYDDALMEPISLPCNVIGGLGFVGVCSESRVIIELPETVWR